MSHRHLKLYESNIECRPFLKVCHFLYYPVIGIALYLCSQARILSFLALTLCIQLVINFSVIISTFLRYLPLSIQNAADFILDPFISCLNEYLSDLIAFILTCIQSNFHAIKNCFVNTQTWSYHSPV